MNIIATIRAEIERRRKAQLDKSGNAKNLFCAVRLWAYADLLGILDSLQEQPELPGIDEEGIPGRDFIPVDWVDACERYGKWKLVRVEQPVEGLDLDSEIFAWQKAHANDDTTQVIAMTARHFAEWGARHAKTPTP